MVRELARAYVGVDPVYTPIPVRPVVHYTMGGIDTSIDAATRINRLYAAGECACVSINGANRLGSNSLTEILIFGEHAALPAAQHARAHPPHQGALSEPTIADPFSPGRSLLERSKQSETPTTP